MLKSLFWVEYRDAKKFGRTKITQVVSHYRVGLRVGCSFQHHFLPTAVRSTTRMR